MDIERLSMRKASYLVARDVLASTARVVKALNNEPVFLTAWSGEARSLPASYPDTATDTMLGDF